MSVSMHRHIFFTGFNEWLDAMYRFSYLSLPIVILSAFFSGTIMVIQASYYVTRFGAESMIGFAAGFVTLKEMGPLFIALMFSGRVGAHNTAEIATMNMTEQIDTLRILTLNPYHVLIWPRIIAMAFSLLCLTIIGDAFSLISGALASSFLLKTSGIVFWQGLTTQVHVKELLEGLIKSFVFGFVIGTVSCTAGMRAEKNVKGIGVSVNHSVVYSALGIFLLDYLVSFILSLSI